MSIVVRTSPSKIVREIFVAFGHHKADHGQEPDDDWDTWGIWNRPKQKARPAQPTKPPPQNLLTIQSTPPPPPPPPASCSSADPEAWVTVGCPFDASRLRAMMDASDVDMEAQQALFLLSQHLPEGSRAANSILARFIKAIAYERCIRNPSAFTNSCAMKARHQVEEEQYG